MEHANNDPQNQHDHDANPLQGYFDWQVTTLMLAHDLASPLAEDEQAAEQRRREIELEVRDLTLAVVPEVYQNDPELAWPPDIMRHITRVTLQRAQQIAESAE